MKFSRSLFGSTLPKFIILEMIFMMCGNPEVWAALPRVNTVLFQVAFVATNCDDISHTLRFVCHCTLADLTVRTCKERDMEVGAPAESGGWFPSHVVTRERDMEVGAPVENGGEGRRWFQSHVVVHDLHISGTSFSVAACVGIGKVERGFPRSHLVPFVWGSTAGKAILEPSTQAQLWKTLQSV